MKVQYVGRLYTSTYRVEVHSHDLWELVYYTHGQGVVRIGEEKVPFAPGDIFLLPPKVEHADYSDQGFRNYHYLFSHFSLGAGDYMKFQDSENHDFLIILKQMYLEYHLKRKNWQNLVDALFEVLDQYILSFSHQQERNSYVSGAVRQMIANLSNPKFDLEEMMERIPLNQDYFRRLFQQHTGVTPLQFLTRKRVEFAQQLLRTRQVTGLSVKEIAWQSGFGDYYYFSRVFKKVTGVCPSRWKGESGEEYDPVIPPRS